MTVVVVSVGIALVVWSVGVSAFYASVLRRRGASPRAAVRVLVRRPTLWLGTVLVVAGFSPVAAGVLLAVGLAAVFLLVARRLVTRPWPRR